MAVTRVNQGEIVEVPFELPDRVSSSMFQY